MTAKRPAQLDPGSAARQSGDRQQCLARDRRKAAVVHARRGVPQEVREQC
jgi:hypothetical protein